MTSNKTFRLVSGFLFALLLLSGCSRAPKYPYRLEMMRPPEVLEVSAIDPFDKTPEVDKPPEIQVFYATDRRPASEREKEPFYTNDRAERLLVGTSTVKIGKEDMTWEEIRQQSLTTKRSGELQMEVIDVNEYGALWSTLSPFDPYLENAESRLPAAEFAAAIDEKLSRSEQKDIYLYVHGIQVNFENPVLRVTELWHYLGYDGVFLAYAWPTIAGDLFAYFPDVETTTYTVRHFRLLLEFLATQTDVRRIHIMSYSAGTRILSEALKELRLIYYNKDKEFLHEHLKIGRALLIGADVDFSTFKTYTRDGLADVPQQIVLYGSREDKILGMAKWLYGKTRLGRSFDKLESKQLAYLAEHDDIVFIDTTDTKGASEKRGHGYFLKSSWVSNDILISFRFDLGPGERGLVRTKENPIWTFPSDYSEKWEEAIRQLTNE